MNQNENEPETLKFHNKIKLKKGFSDFSLDDVEYILENEEIFNAIVGNLKAH